MELSRIMTQHILSLKTFFTMLTNIELVALRHDAIMQNDIVTKDLIDEELKKRVNEKNGIQR
jgi:hypothetical protein